MRRPIYSLAIALLVVDFGWADEPKPKPPAEATAAVEKSAVAEPNAPPRLPAPAGAKALPAPDRVWVDAKRGLVMVDGYVSLREGYLEMFACTAGTKEHESVVAVNSSAFVIHAALLAIGAEPGSPAQYHPKFVPATGTEIDVRVRWLNEKGKWQSAPAQHWVNRRTPGSEAAEKQMTQKWVFAGSSFWTDESTGRRYYQAEAGDFICVSNFSTAMLDIPVESSQANEELLFVANTKQIPPLGTPVRLVLQPKRKAETRRPKAETKKP